MEVRLCDGTALVHIEQLKNLSVNVIAREFANIALLTIRALTSFFAQL